MGGASGPLYGTAFLNISKVISDVELDLVDLGSAVMSFKMVKEWLSEEKQKMVRLANAPIVEGAVLGAVEASLGRNLDQVLAAIEKKSIINKNNL